MGINLFANKADLEAAQSKIASLEADLDASRVELDELKQSASSHAETIAGLQSELTQVKSENESLTASLEASHNEITELKAKITEAEQSAASKAVEILGSAGVPALEVHGSAEANSKEMSRADFNALSPKAQSEFCLKGGKITE